MDIKEYVSKLNDRNIQRNQRSGFTTYALTAAALAISYHLIQLSQDINWKTECRFLIPVAACVFNIILILVILMAIHTLSLRKSSPKIVPSDHNSFTPLTVTILAAMLILPLSVNILSLILFSYKNWYFILTTFLCIVLFPVICIGLYKELASSRKSKIILENPSGSSSYHKKSRTITYLLLVSLLIGSALQLGKFLTSVGAWNHLMWAACIYLLLIIIGRLLDEQSQAGQAKELENLEYEIYTLNLTEDQIIERLQNEHIGITIRKWIEIRDMELNTFEKEFNEHMKEVHILRHELILILIKKSVSKHSDVKHKLNRLSSTLTQKLDEFYPQRIRLLRHVLRDQEIMPENEKNILQELSQKYELSYEKSLDNLDPTRVISKVLRQLLNIPAKRNNRL